MPATIIDGKVVAERIQAEITEEVKAFNTQYGYPPGLAVMLVGDNAASATYVRMKQKACEKVGFFSVRLDFPEDVTTEELEGAILDLNADPAIHGILVQLPLPKQVDEERVLSAVSLEKDVDGFHPVNIGRLAQKGREPLFTPATPTGVMVLLEEAGVNLSGKEAVVIGRSNIVGLPVALMLLKANATVTIAHSRTTNTPELVKQADVVIAAAGIANYVKGDWLKPGAVVIDVGTNKVDAPDTKRGYRLVGDVEFESAVEVASYITKVPGGVGPMTITSLLSNTLKGAKRIATNR